MTKTRACVLFILLLLGASYGAPAGHASWDWWFLIMAGLLATAGLVLLDPRPRRRKRRARKKAGEAVYFPKKRVVDGGRSRRYGPPA